MAVALPLWGWSLAVAAFIFSLFVSYGCGYTNGERDGILWMKLQAIGAGVAKACDFDGGWRWWTRQEIVDQSPWLSRTTTHRSAEE